MLKVCCDFCERPLTTIIIDEFETCTGLAKTKEWNTRKLFPCLCEPCAAKIDMVLRKYKEEVPKEVLLTREYARLNEERRKKLNSEG